jgi:hypothetical protein
MTGEETPAAGEQRRRPRGGPRTPDGKRKSSRNALRHGLSLSPAGDPALCAQAERLAAALAGEGASTERFERCRALAHAQLDVWRVRAVRAALIDTAAAQKRGDATLNDREREGAALLAAWPQLVRLERYDRRAHSRRKRLVRTLDSLD